MRVHTERKWNFCAACDETEQSIMQIQPGPNGMEQNRELFAHVAMMSAVWFFVLLQMIFIITQT